MADLILRGGTVVDGTGAPGRMADVAVTDGVVTGVGSIETGSARVIDATGCIVCPGFIDIHTHYDAQLMWDPTASPSPLHGVTTVIGGNCGFSIAPLNPNDDGYVMRMMARVEGMSLDTLASGPTWDWTTFGQWLDRIDAGLGVNAGFLVGHSTVRRAVMSDRAHDPADAAQIEEMVTLVHAALADGALGFSSSLGEAHTDYEGRPVPSRMAELGEFLALAEAVRHHEGTALEFIPAMGEIPAERIELMTAMSLAANRPLNWNLLGSLSPTEVYAQQLSACDHARRHGADVVALALPDLLRMRTPLLEGLDFWPEVLARPEPDRLRSCHDTGDRSRLAAAAAGLMAQGLSWDLLCVGEGANAGRTIAELAARRSVTPEEALIDEIVPGALPVVVLFPSLTPSLGASEESWAVRGQIWNDDRVVLGGSDAGAHCDLMCHANYPTVVLGEMTRDRELFTLEDAIRRMTTVPARLYGLRSRGRVEPGFHADLVVFDPASIGSGPPVARHDFPGGGTRLYTEAKGVRAVYVNGAAVVEDGRFTGARPGVVLRSGRDTETVTVPGGSRTQET